MSQNISEVQNYFLMNENEMSIDLDVSDQIVGAKKKKNPLEQKIFYPFIGSPCPCAQKSFSLYFLIRIQLIIPPWESTLYFFKFIVII